MLDYKASTCGNSFNLRHAEHLTHFLARPCTDRTFNLLATDQHKGAFDQEAIARRSHAVPLRTNVRHTDDSMLNLKSRNFTPQILRKMNQPFSLTVSVRLEHIRVNDQRGVLIT